MIAAPPPLVLDAAAQWDELADIVIVGGGIAGTCAAIEAASANLDVLVVERASGLGGTSALSGGHFYLGGGTPVQRACGFDDTAENMYLYLAAVSADPDPRKLRLFTDDSVAHFGWLEAQGIPFDRSYYPHKTPIQPGRECLIWSGNEAVWPFRQMAKPVPRGHKVAFDGPEGGGALAMRILIARADALAVRTLCDTQAVRLVRTSDGIVCGIEASRFGKPLRVGGRRGVILAAGGFGFNAALVKELSPERQPPLVNPIGSPNELGAGLLLGLSAGGCGEHLSSVFMTSPFYPPEQLLKGIIVNIRGERFVAEDSYHARTAEFIFRQPKRIAYLILDSQTFAYPEAAKMFNHELVDGWDSVADMARGLGMPAAALAATLDEYNADARAQDDRRYHKEARWLVPLDKPPYAAFDLSEGKARYDGFTLGGLRTSIDGEVLDRDNESIPGLWAVGACASNIAQTCEGYASGTRLAEGSYFGRRAGRAAAKARSVIEARAKVSAQEGPK